MPGRSSMVTVYRFDQYDARFASGQERCRCRAVQHAPINQSVGFTLIGVEISQPTNVRVNRRAPLLRASVLNALLDAAGVYS